MYEHIKPTDVIVCGDFVVEPTYSETLFDGVNININFSLFALSFFSNTDMSLSKGAKVDVLNANGTPVDQPGPHASVQGIGSMIFGNAQIIIFSLIVLATSDRFRRRNFSERINTKMGETILRVPPCGRQHY
jgi:hypothetical protein